MTLEGLYGQFFGFIYGFSLTGVAIIVMRMRERLARLEWLLEGHESKEKKKKGKKETKIKES